MKLALLVLFAALAYAAEPDWPRIEKSAVDLLQQYIRIESINPPANTSEAANFFKGAGLAPRRAAIRTFCSEIVLTHVFSVCIIIIDDT